VISHEDLLQKFTLVIEAGRKKKLRSDEIAKEVLDVAESETLIEEARTDGFHSDI
jgi:hypothetical protein